MMLIYLIKLGKAVSPKHQKKRAINQSKAKTKQLKKLEEAKKLLETYSQQ